MKEIWKDVVGYEGQYQVSDLGNVRSVNWGNRGFTKNLYLKPHNRGYLQVELFRDGTRKTFMVHRLVAQAFIENPNNLPLVNHKDENKYNNTPDNLEWCDNSYNVCYSLNRHGVEAGKRVAPSRHNCKRIGLMIIQCSLYGDKIREWDDARTIFIQTGMSDWSISECCRGKRKTAYGYKWQYAI